MITYDGENRSSLIKHLLTEMYEDLMDNITIDKYEEKENKTFVSGNEIMQLLQSKKPPVN